MECEVGEDEEGMSESWGPCRGRGEGTDTGGTGRQWAVSQVFSAVSLDAKWRWNWGIAGGVCDVREGTEGSFVVVVKMGEKDVYELKRGWLPRN